MPLPSKVHALILLRGSRWWCKNALLLLLSVNSGSKYVSYSCIYSKKIPLLAPRFPCLPFGFRVIPTFQRSVSVGRLGDVTLKKAHRPTLKPRRYPSASEKCLKSCKPLLVQNFNPRRRGSHHKDILPSKSRNSSYCFLHHGRLTRSRRTTD